MKKTREKLIAAVIFLAFFATIIIIDKSYTVVKPKYPKYEIAPTTILEVSYNSKDSTIKAEFQKIVKDFTSRYDFSEISEDSLKNEIQREYNEKNKSKTVILDDIIIKKIHIYKEKQ